MATEVTDRTPDMTKALLMDICRKHASTNMTVRACEAQAERIADAIIAAQSAAPVGESDDPTADIRWNNGCDFAMIQLINFLGIDPGAVRWDAATETVEGDVQAVIGNILRAKFGEDWGPEPTAPPPSPPEVVGWQWLDGSPKKPWSFEWFIAETTYGDRVVLVALPDGWAYDFKTADDTYIKRDKIKRWMQFPDSQFIAALPANPGNTEP